MVDYWRGLYYIADENSLQELDVEAKLVTVKPSTIYSTGLGAFSLSKFRKIETFFGTPVLLFIVSYKGSDKNEYLRWILECNSRQLFEVGYVAGSDRYVFKCKIALCLDYSGTILWYSVCELC